MEGLISILVPCYNGEKYVDRFFESVFSQTYKNYELVIVNDGSIDRTAEIIEKWKEKFLKIGNRFVSLYQENKGQAAAINLAFQQMGDGEYMCWLDADDVLSPDYLSDLKKTLDDNPQAGFAIPHQVEMVLAEDYSQPIASYSRENDDRVTFFEDLITGNLNYGIAKVLVRTECFKAAVPKMEIYESRGGQNWQLILPLAYRYNFAVANSATYTIVVHQDSHSHADKSLEDLDRRSERYEDILRHVVPSIVTDAKELHYYEKIIDGKYAKERLLNAYACGDRATYLKRWRFYKKDGFEITRELRNLSFIMSVPFGKFLYRLMRK